MSHVIFDAPEGDLAVYFSAAVARGRGCAFCGGALSLPCIFHSFMIAADHLFFHPACAAELATFLMADVKTYLSSTNSHVAFSSPSKRGPHPEVA